MVLEEESVCVCVCVCMGGVESESGAVSVGEEEVNRPGKNCVEERKGGERGEGRQRRERERERREGERERGEGERDRKSTLLNSSHL